MIGPGLSELSRPAEGSNPCLVYLGSPCMQDALTARNTNKQTSRWSPQFAVIAVDKNYEHFT